MPSTPKTKNLTINVVKSNNDVANDGVPNNTQTPRTTMFFDDDVDIAETSSEPPAPPQKEPEVPPKDPQQLSPTPSSASPIQSIPMFSNPRAAPQGPQTSIKSEHGLRHMPHTVSANALPTSANRHPYSRGPNASAASLSHGNLLETVSITSSSIPEGTTVMSEDDQGPMYRKAGTETWAGGAKRGIPRQVFRNFLNRSNSIRQTEDPRAGGLRPRLKTSGKHLRPDGERPMGDDPKTAPLDPDSGFRDMMGSRIRNKSADRAIESEEEGVGGKPSTASRDGAELWANIKHGSSRAADGLGRAGKGLLGKFTRSGSDSVRDLPADENYQLKVINLPLIPQVRKTRLRGRMEDARDKTEFWMPSLPYRCIDFLNLKGVEEEGIYRIPGSGREIKHWQSRFDRELDVNLLDEESLYDINIVSSMLKAWLRELPDELLPKTTQSKIANACSGAKTTPQLLKDELSKLPPFNYYTLFAITCHISVLHNHADKNKMNYQNLCICFQPCLKVDGFCFQFLVLDWKNCWTQGCWTEKEYLEKEYALLRETPHQSGAPPSTSSSMTKTYSATSTAASAKMSKSHAVAPGSVGEHEQPRSETSSRANSRPATGRKVLPALTKASTNTGVMSGNDDVLKKMESNTIHTSSAPQSPRKEADANGRVSTPPSLEPVAALSPMRM